MKKFIKDMLSGRGEISAKRVLGMMMIITSQLCIIYLTIRYGNTSTVQSLIETTMITGACLLGVTSVTSIWKYGNGINGGRRLYNDNMDFDYSNYSRYNRQYPNQSSDVYYDMDVNNQHNTTNNPEGETQTDPVDDCCVK